LSFFFPCPLSLFFFCTTQDLNNKPDKKPEDNLGVR
jgi:hypothetical protein